MSHDHHAHAAPHLTPTAVVMDTTATANPTQDMMNMNTTHHPPSMDMHGHSMHGHGHAMSTDMSHMDHGGGMHSMAFHFGHEETILFNTWRTSTVLAFVGSSFLVFFVAVLFEGIKLFRERYVLSRRNQSSVQKFEQNKVAPESSTCCGETANQGRFKHFTNRVKECKFVELASPFVVHHLLDTLLYGLQLTTSYLLMLVFMTYNVWLCIAVISGCMLGYFAFGWKRRSVNSLVDETCH